MAQVFYYLINLDYEKHSVLQFEFHVPFPPPVYVAVHHHLFPEQKFPFTFHCSQTHSRPIAVPLSLCGLWGSSIYLVRLVSVYRGDWPYQHVRREFWD